MVAKNFSALRNITAARTKTTTNTITDVGTDYGTPKAPHNPFDAPIEILVKLCISNIIYINVFYFSYDN